MSNPELALLVAVPILAATLPIVSGLKFDSIGWPIAALAALVEAALAVVVARRVATEGRYVHSLGNYPREYGIELVADGFSAVVVLLIAVVTLAVLGYARRGGPRSNPFYTAYLLLCGGLMGIGLTGDVFNMFVFLEIVGLATYALVATDRSGRSALAALKYLIIGTAGASMYLVGIGFAFVATGTLNMAELATAIPDTVVAPVVHHSAVSATPSRALLARKYVRATDAAACAWSQPLMTPMSCAINSPIASQSTPNRTTWLAATSPITTTVKPKTVAKKRVSWARPAMYRRE